MYYNDECLICLEKQSKKNYVVTKCSHKFHYSCWNNYIGEKIKTSTIILCPICRCELFDFRNIVHAVKIGTDAVKIITDAYTITTTASISINFDIESFIKIYEGTPNMVSVEQPTELILIHERNYSFSYEELTQMRISPEMRVAILRQEEQEIHFQTAITRRFFRVIYSGLTYLYLYFTTHLRV